MFLFCYDNAIVDQIDENLKTALQRDLVTMSPGLQVQVCFYETEKEILKNVIARNPSLQILVVSNIIGRGVVQLRIRIVFCTY